MKLDLQKQIDYLLKITDKVGIIEHGVVDQPDYVEGYCVDDNARALQVCIRLGDQYPVLKEVQISYINFLKSAIKEEGLYNDQNADLTWKNNFLINGEHYGRALYALGEAGETKAFDQIYGFFNKTTTPHLRVAAEVILGLQFYQSKEIEMWAEMIIDQYYKEKTDGWKWYEPILSYDIGRIPMALLVAYQVTANDKYLEVAVESLDFLSRITFNEEKNCFIFPGNNGWFTKEGKRVVFDEQPIEAGSMTEVYVKAWQVIRDDKYKNLAIKAFDWYNGKNVIGVNMINENGGIYDGFSDDKINYNQGAESVLAYLLACNCLMVI